MKKHKEKFEALKKKFEKHRTKLSEYAQQIQPEIAEIKWATEPQLRLELLQMERAMKI